MGARDYRRSPVIRIIARFQLTTATNQKFGTPPSADGAF